MCKPYAQQTAVFSRGVEVQHIGTDIEQAGYSACHSISSAVLGCLCEAHVLYQIGVIASWNIELQKDSSVDALMNRYTILADGTICMLSLDVEPSFQLHMEFFGCIQNILTAHGTS